MAALSDLKVIDRASAAASSPLSSEFEGRFRSAPSFWIVEPPPHTQGRRRPYSVHLRSVRFGHPLTDASVSLDIGNWWSGPEPEEVPGVTLADTVLRLSLLMRKFTLTQSVLAKEALGLHPSEVSLSVRLQGSVTVLARFHRRCANYLLRVGLLAVPLPDHIHDFIVHKKKKIKGKWVKPRWQ